ncbi:CENP-B homolog protein 2-like protein [Tanacetum coccineum]|uniref:CENP-B homolog protein 2-like protein n=1 Tax=Tanacetum coccineum TaxID=301880 RepID=A0ABQ5IV23_9ASTR
MQLEGKKQDKERLTVAICCNEDGSEKLPLWIIGKYAKPRCFKNVNLNSLNWVPNPAKINVLDAMNLAISAWTMDVSANTSGTVSSHCKLRSTDNMTFENSDEGGESTQELQNLIKELGYRNAMDVEDVLTHPEENVVAQLLTDEEIIESVIGINKDDIDEEDDESSTMEPPSRNELFKRANHLQFLLSY